MEDFSLIDFVDTLDASRRKVRGISFGCSCEGCKEKAIDKSHLLQQNPFIYSIADEKKKVYQFSDNEIHPRTSGLSFSKLQKIPVDRALCYPLFCAKHDSELFKPIETKGFDIEDIKNQLLFCYRSLCAQRYLEQKSLAFYKENGFEGEFYESQIMASHYVIEIYNNTVKALWNDIQSSDLNDYMFKVVTMPRLPICLSDCIIDDNDLCDIFNVLYIHLLPFERESKLILGYHKSHVSNNQIDYYDSWRLYYSTTDSKAINGLLARCKNWCCSPSYIQDEDYFVEELDIERVKIHIKENCMLFTTLDCISINDNDDLLE